MLFHERSIAKLLAVAELSRVVDSIMVIWFPACIRNVSALFHFVSQFPVDP
jgi:hypothetical protein